MFIALLFFGAIGAEESSNNTYKEVSTEVQRLNIPREYKQIGQKISKTDGVFGYYTDVTLRYENTTNKKPAEIQSDLEEAFVQLGCKRTKESGYQYDLQSELNKPDVNFNIIETQEVSIGVKPIRVIDQVEGTGLPHVCTSKVRYYFKNSIDTQDGFWTDDQYPSGNREVEGLDYNKIDFSQYPVDKFIIYGSYI